MLHLRTRYGSSLVTMEMYNCDSTNVDLFQSHGYFKCYWFQIFGKYIFPWFYGNSFAAQLNITDRQQIQGLR